MILKATCHLSNLWRSSSTDLCSSQFKTTAYCSSRYGLIPLGQTRNIAAAFSANDRRCCPWPCAPSPWSNRSSWRRFDPWRGWSAAVDWFPSWSSPPSRPRRSRRYWYDGAYPVAVSATGAAPCLWPPSRKMVNASELSGLLHSSHYLLVRNFPV